MSLMLRKSGICVMRYWKDEEARYEVYRGESSLSNLRREDVEALVELLQAALVDAKDEKAAP